MRSTPVPFWLAGAPQASDVRWSVPHRGTAVESSPLEVLSEVCVAGPEHLEQALEAAARARRECAALPRHRRREALLGVAEGLRQRAEEFAARIVAEMGKPITDARSEVTRAIQTFELAAEACDERAGEFLDLDARPSTAGRVALTRRVPVGVCSFVTPFNFPLNLVAHKVAPAIAAGCPFVLKPSDKTPLSSLALAELLAQQELPRGAWSVLPLAVEDVGPMIDDPRVALLSFTGSESVGWELARRAGGRRMALELGGNAACVVGADADLEQVVSRLLVGGFSNSGQSCISVQRVLAAEGIYEDLREALADGLRGLELGDPRRESTRVGPLIDELAAKRVAGLIAEAVDAGAELLCGGERRGRFVTPTLLEGVPPDARFETEELFGPGLSLARFEDLHQGLAAADRGRFGLQLGVFGLDFAEVLDAADRVEVGGLMVDDVPTFRADALPYGGRRRSGLGREGPRSAIEELTEPQVIVFRRR
jgi:acyl-CoA reductase-like NAD-dependent aldehyde dehydrogenase